MAGETPMIQSQSGERAFAISTESIQAIAQNGRNFNTFTTLAPGVVAGTVNGLRANQNTTQIDGVTSMDTGNNGNAVTLTLDAVQEVKVLTTSYQAEYGRSAGAQISAVTKSGGNEFHGSIYADRRKDDLNSNTWLNKRNGLPKAKVNQSDEGYTLGGPDRQNADCSSSATRNFSSASTRTTFSASASRPRSSAAATSRRRATIPETSST